MITAVHVKNKIEEDDDISENESVTNMADIYTNQTIKNKLRNINESPLSKLS